MVREERKEREFQARRAEILEQAEKIFAAKGYHNVTMAEIANASGFSIGSLYQFFSGKESLYSTMICDKLDLMYLQIRDQVKKAEGIEGKIEAIIKAHFLFVEENTDFCRLFLPGESAVFSEVMLSMRQKMINDYKQHLLFIENVLRTGTKNGYLRPLPVDALARALFGLIRTTAMDWMIAPVTKKMIMQKDFIMEIFLRGVKQNGK